MLDWAQLGRSVWGGAKRWKTPNTPRERAYRSVRLVAWKDGGEVSPRHLSDLLTYDRVIVDKFIYFGDCCIVGMIGIFYFVNGFFAVVFKVVIRFEFFVNFS